MIEQENNDKIDFNTKSKAAKKYHELGYNVIRILGEGKQFDHYENREGRTFLIEKLADGKSAEGTGKWKQWIETKQSDVDFENILESMKEGDGIAIIHGGISESEAEEIDYDSGKIKIRKTSSVAFECDGEGVDIFWEAVLTSGDLRHKLMKTPRVRSPHGGLHWLCRVFKERNKKTGEEIKLPSQDLYQGKGHNEIKLLSNGKYTLAPPSANYTFETCDFSKTAILTMEEITRLANLIKRIDRRATSGSLWIDTENYQDLTNDQDTKYKLIEIAKVLYQAATVDNQRHNTALAYAGILKRYVKVTENDAYTIIDNLHPNDIKNHDAVKNTYEKKDNEITSMTTFRKLVIELLGEVQADEIMDEILSLTVPERTFYSDKPDGKLLGLAVDNVELCFFDQDKIAYALIKNKKTDSYQIIRLKHEEFKLNLSRWFVDNNRGDTLAGDQHKKHTIDTLTSLITRKPITLHDRAVWLREENTLNYNLNNEHGQIVKVNPAKDGNGVTIVKQNPDLILFRRLPDNCKQVTPLLSDDIEIALVDGKCKYLEPLCTGIKHYTHKIIFQCWLIALYFNSVSYPIIYTTGPERNGKTTMLKLAKSLFDPIEDLNTPIKERTNALAETLKTDRYDLEDVNLSIYNSSFIIFDNISKFTPELEDNMCQWVTGFAYRKRKLWENTEMVNIGGTRPIGYTGITNVATRPDHIARIVTIDVEIEENTKKLEDELLTAFYNNKPKILIYIFKIISKVLANYDEMKAKIIKTNGVGKTLPDFELLCEIIARCMNYPDNTFHNAWDSIRDEQVDLGLDNSMAAIVLENYISDQYTPDIIEKTEHKLEEKPSVLHKEQWEYGKTKGLIKDNDTRFPQTPEAYAKELYKMKRSFGHIGVKIEKGERTGKRRTIIIDYNDWKDRDTPKIEEMKIQSKNEPKDLPSGIDYECYYCKENSFRTTIKSDYETHQVKHHSGLTAYPNYAEIERRGLIPQGKVWEGNPIPKNKKKDAKAIHR